MAKNKLSKLTEVSTGDYPMASSSSKMSAEDKLRQRRYRAEDALRCLTRANEIVKDKELMSDVAALAQEQMKNTKAALAQAKTGKKAA